MLHHHRDITHSSSLIMRIPFSKVFDSFPPFYLVLRFTPRRRDDDDASAAAGAADLDFK